VATIDINDCEIEDSGLREILQLPGAAAKCFSNVLLNSHTKYLFYLAIVYCLLLGPLDHVRSKFFSNNCDLNAKKAFEKYFPAGHRQS